MLVRACVQIHPDGILLAAGADDSVVSIWDIKQVRCERDTRVLRSEDRFHAVVVPCCVRSRGVQNGKNVAKLEGHSARINAVSFSENGIYMASGSDDGSVKVRLLAVCVRACVCACVRVFGASLLLA